MDSILSIMPGANLPSTMTLTVKLSKTNDLDIYINLYANNTDLSGIVLSDNIHTLTIRVGNCKNISTDLNSNNITLPLQWPKKLKILNLFNCIVDNIAPLPDELKVLYVSGNHNMTHLPEQLPATLCELVCHDCSKLLKLPDVLPPSLEELNINNALIINIPQLPISLRRLYILETMVRKLPQLPANLRVVECYSFGENKDKCCLEMLPDIPIDEYNIACISRFTPYYFISSHDRERDISPFLKLYPEYENIPFKALDTALYINTRNCELSKSGLI